MEYISAEEFLKHPKEVQKVFLDWWKPERFDLCIHSIAIEYNESSVILEKNNDFHIVIAENDGITITVKNDLIPLFTECQIRKFIEDKTNSTIEFLYLDTGYSIRCIRKDISEDNIIISKLSNDLLKAYWQVAIKIAKEGLNDN